MELCRITREVAAPAKPMWDLLADFANPQVLARTIEQCETTGEGAGATRTLRARGLVIEERLVECDEDRLRYVYEVLPTGDMPAPALRTYRATVQMRPLGPGRTEVEWSCEADVEGPVEPVRAQISTLYAGAIANLEAEANARAGAGR
jgi:carbon monoxide dehydrogenase subunit G